MFNALTSNSEYINLKENYKTFKRIISKINIRKYFSLNILYIRVWFYSIENLNNLLDF